MLTGKNINEVKESNPGNAKTELKYNPNNTHGGLYNHSPSNARHLSRTEGKAQNYL